MSSLSSRHVPFSLYTDLSTQGWSVGSAFSKERKNRGEGKLAQVHSVMEKRTSPWTLNTKLALRICELLSASLGLSISICKVNLRHQMEKGVLYPKPHHFVSIT